MPAFVLMAQVFSLTQLFLLGALTGLSNENTARRKKESQA